MTEPGGDTPYATPAEQLRVLLTWLVGAVGPLWLVVTAAIALATPSLHARRMAVGDGTFTDVEATPLQVFVGAAERSLGWTVVAVLVVLPVILGVAAWRRAAARTRVLELSGVDLGGAVWTVRGGDAEPVATDPPEEN